MVRGPPRSTLFPSRTLFRSMLARKPYLDGAVRELTMGDDKTVDEMTTIMRNAIAQSKSGDPNADVRLTRHASRAPRRNMQITLRSQPDEEMKQEVRRNPDDYQQSNSLSSLLRSPKHSARPSWPTARAGAGSPRPPGRLLCLRRRPSLMMIAGMDGRR